MNEICIKDLSERRLRVNSHYRFVPFGAQPGGWEGRLADLAESRDYAGVLVPDGSGLSMKAISPETAALLASITHARKVSQVLPAMTPDARSALVASLVFDYIFEIEADAGFVTGAHAFESIVEPIGEIEGVDRLQRQSLDALVYGEKLGLEDADALAARLYFYGRKPVGRRWMNLWPGREAVRAHLRLPASGLLPGRLAQLYEQGGLQAASQWLSWHRRGARQSTAARDGLYKLYVSPVARKIVDAFEAVLACLADVPARSLKIGQNAYGLLRPDKLVLYFEERDALFDFATSLRHRLSGIEAHGVPFTCVLDETGMVSWGRDPARETARADWYRDDSWRLWICNRLASALVAGSAARQSTGLEAWRYALVRLSLMGVDTSTWTKRADATELTERDAA